MIQLKDICDIYDCPHTTAKDEGKGYPLVRTPNVGKGRLILDGIHRVSEDVYNSRNARAIPEEGDLILAREAPVGNVSIIMDGQRVCLGQRVVLIKPKRELVDPHFLTYYLLSAEVQHRLKNHANGAVVAHLNVSDIRNLWVTLPELEEQVAIGKILRSIDDKIELNRQINDNLEQQAQAAFNNIIAHYSECETINLSEIAVLNPKRAIAKGTLARSIEMAHLPTSGSFPAGWDMKEYNGGMKFQNGDTLMARITPCLENGKVAYINFLEENEVAFGSTEYIVIASKGAIAPEVFYFLTRHNDFVDFAVKNMNGSSGRQRVSAETIGTYKLPVISPEDLVILETIAKEALNKIKYNSLENIRLSEIRDTLLPKLMSGELKINEIDC